MSEDDLVKRLRSGSYTKRGADDLIMDAADRIEALEAALAKADELVSALNWYADQSAIMSKPTIDSQWATDRLRSDRGSTAIMALTAYRQARDATR